jgi:presenilin-like A22 family membrane protease
VIVIERDGQTIVITGWRAWLIGAVAVIVVTAVLAALAFLVLGIAVSVVAFLVILMPAVAIGVLMAWVFQPRRG